MTVGEECSREESILGGGSFKIRGPLPGSVCVVVSTAAGLCRGCPTQWGPLVTFDEGQEGRPGLLSFPDLKFFNILSRSCSETRFHIICWMKIHFCSGMVKVPGFLLKKIYRIFKQREFDSVLPSFTDLLFFFFFYIYLPALGLSCSMKVKVAQLCPTLCDPMDYIIHGVLQARILEWVAFPFSRGSSALQVFCIAGRFFTSWARREAQEYWSG